MIDYKTKEQKTPTNKDKATMHNEIKSLLIDILSTLDAILKK